MERIMPNSRFKNTVSFNGKDYTYYDLKKLGEDKNIDMSKLPYSIRVLCENLLRKMDGEIVAEKDIDNIAGWKKDYDEPVEIAYFPARVIMQDFTGVPGVVDLAAMRDAVDKRGKSPELINPLVPVDLIVDHSVQVDYYGTDDSLDKNVALEYHRNTERYELLKWAQKSFKNMRIVPPNSGICHQVNLEYLGKIIDTRDINGEETAICDTCVGTDSHTPMINSIGVVAWGVGGIEAEAVMLGQPYYMSVPEVIGVKLTGEIADGITGTDVVLTITEMLRQHRMVEKFVEYFGPGLKSLKLPDRATISNMSPEYGSTIGFFPVDDETLRYMRNTNRSEEADFVELVAKENMLYYDENNEPEYTKVLEVDLSTVKPCVAGPSRPQDRIVIEDLKNKFDEMIGGANEQEMMTPEIKQTLVNYKGEDFYLKDGSLVIAAITSCTNTSNPFLIIGAGMIAKKAVELGMKVPAQVKTSLAPGSRVVTRYLEKSGMLPYLEKIGFNIAAYGCTTCIGNSGPLPEVIDKAVTENGLTVAAVLSGNRNFEARIHQKVRANYLASPMLVVAYALAGRVDFDITTEPIGKDKDGNDVYMTDLWPETDDVWELVNSSVFVEQYKEVYSKILDGDENWQKLDSVQSSIYAWKSDSTYIQNPPFFTDFNLDEPQVGNISGAKALLVLGDTVTTDHISPAGAIPDNYPAGEYLSGQGVDKSEYNSYGSRRGNHEVMMRGTFANVRIKNQLVAPKEGGLTRMEEGGEEMFVYDAAMKYVAEGTPTIVLGGKDYGTGSSRDWAAKGTMLLGVKAVIAESFERIHRSNLLGMGVLPLKFQDGQGWKSLGLTGYEEFSIKGIENLSPRCTLRVSAKGKDGKVTDFDVLCRLDTDVEVKYYKNGGILPFVLRQMVK